MSDPRTLHWEEVDRMVRAARKVDPVSSIEALKYSLECWWCVKFNRPLKDPLLQQYTLNELVYEFLFYHYQDPENDPDKNKEVTDSVNEDEEWAKKQIEAINKKKEPPKAEELSPEVKTMMEQAPDVISTNFDT
jgi:hypothetical protein